MPQASHTASFKLSLVVVVFSIVLQTDTCAAANHKAVKKGAWGGDHIAIEVSEKGAEVDVDCAQGQGTQPLKLDKDRRFKVSGTFTAEHAGPRRPDEAPESAPGRYSR